VGFEAAAAKNIKPHAGCVVKVFTGIDYQMCATCMVAMSWRLFGEPAIFG
jgi:hypothetical protein